jgi:hypothetical protein
MELPNGVFITMMPLAVAAGISTLSTQARRPGDDLRRGFGGGADREAVVIADDLGELVLVLAERRLEIDIDASVFEDLHGSGGERVGNEYFGGGHVGSGNTE